MSSVVGRRAFLRWSGGLASVGGGLEALRAAEQRGGPPVNIIWMVADGMSAGVLPMAEHFSLRARGKGTIWPALHARPEAAQALVDMASLTSMVTDSSSASSAWATGSRILNGWVNMLPDGTRLTPIGVLARQQGKRVGLVTTTTVTHATPAGFAAVSKDRDDEAGIATQYIDVCEVVLGGGTRFFDAATRKDKRDLVAEYQKAGFATISGKRQLQDVKGPRVLGLFSSSHLPYCLDLRNDSNLAPGVPSLAEMTETALRLLSGSRKGFLLQVEGGRVDHAAHDNDAASMLWEQLAFDDAIGVVLRFAEKNPETLVVITTDHGNSNPGLNGMGTEYGQSDACFERLLAAKSSFSRVIPRLTPRPNAQQVKEAIRAAFGIGLEAEETEWLRAVVSGAKRLAINKQYDKTVGVLGQILSNHAGVGWTGTSHTSDYAVLTAVGPGAGRFRGFLRNTGMFPVLCGFMGIKYRNPSMTPERARELRSAMRDPVPRPHWVSA